MKKKLEHKQQLRRKPRHVFDTIEFAAHKAVPVRSPSMAIEFSFLFLFCVSLLFEYGNPGNRFFVCVFYSNMATLEIVFGCVCVLVFF